MPILLQGLERHLLGSHGLVTSSMQEAANKGKDAGRCPACGRVSFLSFLCILLFCVQRCARVEFGRLNVLGITILEGCGS